MKTHTAFNLVPFFGIIRVSGADRAEFLHNQLSNDIKHLAPTQACLATYNNAKGRVMANLVVLNTGTDLLIITARDLCAALIQKLRMYVLRSQVTLTELSDYAVAASLPQNTDSDINSYGDKTPALRLTTTEEHGCWFITLPDQSCLQTGEHQKLATTTTDDGLWQQYEIHHGYPWIDAASSQTCVAQMLNQQLIGAIDFKKGCYPGQEVIARAQYRGQVKRGLAALVSDQPCQNGEAIFNPNEEEVGLIINHQSHDALAVIRHSAINEPLHCQNNNTLMIRKCFFATADQTAAE
ncbi:folate-binding protein [Neisseriaceae bacterium ESL0693]|nr:folate-binding protein [Neisseriaceae bacterium ESL0693]